MDQPRKQFLAMYLIPRAAIDSWAATPASEREAAEQKMRAEWAAWSATHAAMIRSTYGCGKTKRLTAAGLGDTRNDLVVCSVLEAASHEAATRIHENHPHLQIPTASIEIMEIRPMPGAPG